MENIVLKIGGSVITGKAQDKLSVNKKNLDRIAGEIASALRKKNIRLFLVHGAGPFGHIPAKKYRLKEGMKSKMQVKGFSVTHQSMEKLNLAVVESLMKKGIPAVSFQPSSGGILENGKLVRFPIQQVKQLMTMGIVPVSYGDVLVDTKKGVGILSGDQLVPYAAKKLKVDRIIISTDVDGIFDCDPKCGGIKLIPVITRKNLNLIKLSGSKATDVTGGMAGKVAEILRCGVNCEVISAVKPGNVKNILLAKNIKCTKIIC